MIDTVIREAVKKFGLSDGFLYGAADMANWLGVDLSELLNVMWLESRLDPTAVNPVSGATGLIQFMPSTAQSLGTSTDQIKRMSAERQLKLVRAYLTPYRSKIKDIADLYLAIFFPAAIGKDDSYILQTSRLSAGLIARQNSIYDLNKDEKITKGEVKKAITDKVSRSGIPLKKKMIIGGSTLLLAVLIAYGIYTYQNNN